MPAAAYIRAALPQQYRILGIPLKPFCLGHYFHMAALELAFASDNPIEPTIDDLSMAVAICSKTYEEFQDWYYAVEKQDARNEQLYKWGEECGPFDLLEKISLFNKYLKESLIIPKYWESNGEKSTSGAHWSQSVLLTLTSDLGYTQNEAINTPLGKAFMDFFKNAENKGLLTLMTAEDESLIAAMETKSKEDELCQS